MESDFALTSPQVFGDESDHWPTPAWVTEALLERDPPPKGWVVEPSAGEGGIVKPLARAGYNIVAIEIRSVSPITLDGGESLVCPDVHIVIRNADWLSVRSDELCDCQPAFSIVCNPPYAPASAMLAHVKHCFTVGAEYIAALLPVNFFCSADRAAFHVAHPVSGFYPLSRRPRFVGGGGQRDIAWFVWRKGATTQRVEVVP
jgi:hypothetical protein